MNSGSADSLRDSASDTGDRLQRAADSKIQEGKRQAGALVDQSGDLINKAGTRAGEAAADLGRRVISYTKENPLTALLLAVGAGALLIGATRSRQSRR
jgi:ElaB/YqjD/DUF883 family membrane-anchored ribosome-binding protein